ncbi:MAG: DNA topoisomerase VI subunit B, partial [Nitrospira sp.]
AASEFRRRNIFDLYIEEVVEACNRLKGGKLPTEQLKEQLHKIASTRTGGLKTDEALGKTGAGPEGLPHSIIVTTEGIEGETDVAQQATTTPVMDGTPSQADRRSKVKTPVKGEAALRETLVSKDIPTRGKSKPAAAAKAKVGQQDLFVEPASSGKKAALPKRKRTVSARLRKGK